MTKAQANALVQQLFGKDYYAGQLKRQFGPSIKQVFRVSKRIGDFAAEAELISESTDWNESIRQAQIKLAPARKFADGEHVWHADQVKTVLGARWANDLQSWCYVLFGNLREIREKNIETLFVPYTGGAGASVEQCERNTTALAKAVDGSLKRIKDEDGNEELWAEKNGKRCIYDRWGFCADVAMLDQASFEKARDYLLGTLPTRNCGECNRQLRDDENCFNSESKDVCDACAGIEISDDNDYAPPELFYAAARLTCEQARKLANDLLNAVNSKKHDSLDVVIAYDSLQCEVTIEDEGIVTMIDNCEVLDYGNDNVNAFTNFRRI